MTHKEMRDLPQETMDNVTRAPVRAGSQATASSGADAKTPKRGRTGPQDSTQAFDAFFAHVLAAVVAPYYGGRA